MATYLWLPAQVLKTMWVLGPFNLESIQLSKIWTASGENVRLAFMCVVNGCRLTLKCRLAFSFSEMGGGSSTDFSSSAASLPQMNFYKNQVFGACINQQPQNTVERVPSAWLSHPLHWELSGNFKAFRCQLNKPPSPQEYGSLVWFRLRITRKACLKGHKTSVTNNSYSNPDFCFHLNSVASCSVCPAPKHKSEVGLSCHRGGPIY
jgi:hypothetical protein